jgi:hypothetical protein
MTTSKTAEQRYLEKLVVGPKDCISWGASIDKYGNAKFTYTDREGRHRDTSGHKFGWVLVNGPVPEGQKLKNTCGLGSCQNMAHWTLLGDGKGLTTQQRYEARFTRLGPDECWPWQEKGRDKDGYGLLAYRKDGKSLTVRATRFGWDLAHPDDLLTEKDHVCHTCDNPPCQNPAHWFKGLAADNSADMVLKGRHHYGRQRQGRQTQMKQAQGVRPDKRSGEHHYGTHLTWDDVIEMRRRYARGTATQQILATEFKIGREAIGKILRNERWIVDSDGNPIGRAEHL